MIRRIGEYFVKVAERFVPDPFIFAILLTVLTFVLDLALTSNSATQALTHWHRGFWELLTFGMQMSLIIITGYALADARPVRRIISVLADLPNGTAGAAFMTAMVSCLVAFVHWGLGLIVGALLAAEVGRNALRDQRAIHYPLIGAAGYAGLLVWHGGLSGSAPVKVATMKDLAEVLGPELAQTVGVMPVSMTIGSLLNLIVGGCLLLIIPAVCAAMSPPKEACVAPPASLLETDRPGELDSRGDVVASTPAHKLEESRALTGIICCLGAGYIVMHFVAGRGLTFNVLNLIFLVAGLALHGSPRAYRDSFASGVRGAGGIILQFPFYGGIMGMMKYSDAGPALAQIIADGFVSISTATTLPIWTFFSAGLVNLFVPSGGGQWAVQGPVVMEAAHQMGVSYPRVLLALAYGDQWTNMLQPFWALALLGITQLRASQIIGYTMVLLIASAPVFILGLALLPM